MKGHPGGKEHTLELLTLSGLRPPAAILDMGAGSGEAVRMLRDLGYAAEGIDLEPRSADVHKGDFLRAPYPELSFEGIISQCSFAVSGDPERAISEAYRLLRSDGMLMLSDVWFTNAPEAVEKAGFQILHRRDMTALWREYYLTALWQEDSVPCGIRGRCTYELLICKKI